MNNTTLLLDPSDNVGVALSDLEPGQKVAINGIELEIQEFVAAKHKFAIRDFQPGEDILMYGTIVGEATQAIPGLLLLPVDVGVLPGVLDRFLGVAEQLRFVAEVALGVLQHFLAALARRGGVGDTSHVFLGGWSPAGRFVKFTRLTKL